MASEDEETPSNLPSTSGSSYEGMTPSTSSISTGPEKLFEQLDEKGTKAVLRAITHKFEVDWKNFDFTDLDDTEKAINVYYYLDALLGSKQDSQKSEKYSSLQTKLYDSYLDASSPLLPSKRDENTSSYAAPSTSQGN